MLCLRLIGSLREEVARPHLAFSFQGLWEYEQVIGRGTFIAESLEGRGEIRESSGRLIRFRALRT